MGTLLAGHFGSDWCLTQAKPSISRHVPPERSTARCKQGWAAIRDFALIVPNEMEFQVAEASNLSPPMWQSIDSK